MTTSRAETRRRYFLRAEPERNNAGRRCVTAPASRPSGVKRAEHQQVHKFPQAAPLRRQNNTDGLPRRTRMRGGSIHSASAELSPLHQRRRYDASPRNVRLPGLRGGSAPHACPPQCERAKSTRPLTSFLSGSSL